MKFILGKKLGMTQIFDETGRVIPVTVVAAEPNRVRLVRTGEQDGYAAVQVAYGPEGPRKEFRGSSSTLKPGDTLVLQALFSVGDTVWVRGLAKGKGFQGVVKRHGFSGGPKSHGQKDRHRAPGSIGSSFPEHVPKGRRMAGRMGGQKVTVRNLEVIRIDPERHVLFLKGAIPGRRGTLVEIRSVSQ